MFIWLIYFLAIFCPNIVDKFMTQWMFTLIVFKWHSTRTTVKTFKVCVALILCHSFMTERSCFISPLYILIILDLIEQYLERMRDRNRKTTLLLTCLNMFPHGWRNLTHYMWCTLFMGNYGIRVKDGHTVEQGIMGNTAIVGVRFVKVKQGIVI